MCSQNVPVRELISCCTGGGVTGLSLSFEQDAVSSETAIKSVVIKPMFFISVYLFVLHRVVVQDVKILQVLKKNPAPPQNCDEYRHNEIR